MKAHLVTPYCVSHLHRCGVMVRGNVTVCTDLKRDHRTVIGGSDSQTTARGLKISSISISVCLASAMSECFQDG